MFGVAVTQVYNSGRGEWGRGFRRGDLVTWTHSGESGRGQALGADPVSVMGVGL